jgi:tetratricopeptide (TPR) repeat protein
MKGLNSIIINFILPIVVLYFVFRINSLLGWLLVLIFILYSTFKSRSDIYAHIGNNAYMKGNEEKAFIWIKKAATLKESKVKFKIGYAFLLVKRDQIEAAEKIINEILNSSATKDDKFNARVTLSLVEWKKGRLYYAINILEDVYSNFKNTNLYVYLGFLYLLKGDIEKAIKFNEEAYEYNDTNSLILNNLAQVYFKAEDFDKCEEILVKLLEKTPNYSEPYYLLGFIMLQKGEQEKAKNYFKQAQIYKVSFFSTLNDQIIKGKIDEQSI